MKYIYEIELGGRTISIDPDIWRKISNNVNSNKWFYVVYLDKYYKYERTHSFYDRPAIYMFKLIDSIEEDEIEYIYI